MMLLRRLLLEKYPNYKSRLDFCHFVSVRGLKKSSNNVYVVKPTANRLTSNIRHVSNSSKNGDEKQTDRKKDLQMQDIVATEVLGDNIDNNLGYVHHKKRISNKSSGSSSSISDSGADTGNNNNNNDKGASRQGNSTTTKSNSSSRFYTLAPDPKLTKQVNMDSYLTYSPRLSPDNFKSHWRIRKDKILSSFSPGATTSTPNNPNTKTTTTATTTTKTSPHPTINITETRGVKFDVNTGKAANLVFNNVLVVSKLSRYQSEKSRYPTLTDDEISSTLKAKGSLFSGLKKRNDMHHSYLNRVVQVLEEKGFNVRVVPVNEYSDKDLVGIDVVISAGGDGTFLTAASKIRPVYSKGNIQEYGYIPLVGINTDIERSAGHLCLRNVDEYGRALEPEDIIFRLLSKKFQWIRRSRIQTTIYDSSRYPSLDLAGIIRADNELDRSAFHVGKKIIPDLALNEVLYSSNDPSKTSYYEMHYLQKNFHDNKNNHPNPNLTHIERHKKSNYNVNAKGHLVVEKQKSSGMLISTGTGTSAWIANASKMWRDDVMELLTAYYAYQTERGRQSKNTELMVKENVKNFNVNELTYLFNQSRTRNLTADDQRIMFVARDLINSGVFKAKHHRGIVDRLAIRSRSTNASLYIDGGEGDAIYPFPTGSLAEFEILPQNGLLTMTF